MRRGLVQLATWQLAVASVLGVGSRLNRAIDARGLLALANREAEEAVYHLTEMRRLQLEPGWCDAAIQPHGAPDLVEALVATGGGPRGRGVQSGVSARTYRSRRRASSPG